MSRPINCRGGRPPSANPAMHGKTVHLTTEQLAVIDAAAAIAGVPRARWIANVAVEKALAMTRPT